MSSMRKAEGEELEQKSIPAAVGEVALEGREVEVHVKQRTTLTTKDGPSFFEDKARKERRYEDLVREPKKKYMWRCATLGRDGKDGVEPAV